MYVDSGFFLTPFNIFGVMRMCNVKPSHPERLLQCDCSDLAPVQNGDVNKYKIHKRHKGMATKMQTSSGTLVQN